MPVAGGLDVQVLIINCIERIDISLVDTHFFNRFLFFRLGIRLFCRYCGGAQGQDYY
jgi:hypothetical protein